MKSNYCSNTLLRTIQQLSGNISYSQSFLFKQTFFYGLSLAFSSCRERKQSSREYSLLLIIDPNFFASLAQTVVIERFNNLVSLSLSRLFHNSISLTLYSSLPPS